jgi:hypothetical protein
MCLALHIDLSTNACVAAYLDPDGKLKLNKMEYTLAELNKLKEDER